MKSGMGARLAVLLGASVSAIVAAACQLIDRPSVIDDGTDTHDAAAQPAADVAPGDATPDGRGDGTTFGRGDAPGLMDATADAGSTSSDGASGANDGSSAGTCDANLLGDPSNCGRCGRACLAQATCMAGQCVASLSLPDFEQVNGLAPIAGEAGALYFDYGDPGASGGIGSEDLNTSISNNAIVSLQTGPAELALQGPWVFWADRSGSMWRANRDGSNPTRLGNALSDPTWGSTCVAVNSTYVYWVDDKGYLERASLDGGANSGTVWPSSGSGVAGPAAEAQCVAANDAWVAHPAAQASNLLLIEDLNAGVTRQYAAPPSPNPLEAVGVAAPVAVAGSWVYFTTAPNDNAFNLYRVIPDMPSSESHALARINGTVFGPGLVADGRGVYWALNAMAGGIQGCSDPACAGNVDVDLTSTGCNVCSVVALDSRYVYYGGGSPGIFAMER
jgi:hypothetical protein